MTRLISFLSRLFGRRRGVSHRLLVVRRVTIHCPHSGQLVEADLLMRNTGTPDFVFRCSAHPNRPPACDQSCRQSAESALAPVNALIIYPPGTGPPEEID